jgi:hypothetical protein
MNQIMKMIGKVNGNLPIIILFQKLLLLQWDKVIEVIQSFQNIKILGQAVTQPQQHHQALVLGDIRYIYSMPKASRFPIREKEDVGPGSYRIGTTIGLIPKYHFEK